MLRMFVPVLLGCLITVTAAASAAGEGDQADIKLANQFFEVGKTYYSQGDYERALDAFEQSYRHSGKPALLYNIGKCHESLGRLEEAIEQFEFYVRDSGGADGTVVRHINNLKARLRRQQEREDARRRAGAPATAAPGAVAPQPSTTSPVDGQAPVETPSATTAAGGSAAGPTDQRPSRWMTWAGWSLVGVGAASVVASIVLGARASSKSKDVESAMAEGRQWSDVEGGVFQEGERLEVAQIATMVVGLLAAAGGVALLVLRPGPREAKASPTARAQAAASTASLAPMVRPGGGGVVGLVTF